MTDGNTYAIDHYLLEREDYDQREENDAELFNLRCEVDVLTGMLADLHDAQTYTYIGKDGKSVLARDLEDQLHEMKAKLIEVEAERDAAMRAFNENWVTHQRVIAAEAALAAAYRLAFEAGANLAETHFVDAGITGQREHAAGKIIASAIRATPTPTSAELMARINEGEKE